MASISISADVRKAKKKLTNQQKKQIPFALSRTLNDLAFDARKAEQNAQRQYIDRPTPFTQKGYQVKRSNKTNLTARLLIPANRWKYIKHQAQGGSSTRVGSHAIPINKALTNKYGSLPRNKSATLLRRKNHFQATINGLSGIWKRDKSGRLSLQIAFKDTTQHSAIYPIWKAAKRVIGSKSKSTLDKNLRHALATAR